MSEVEKWNFLYMILFPDADINMLPPACKYTAPFPLVTLLANQARDRDEREKTDARLEEAALCRDFLRHVRKKFDELLQKDSELLGKIYSQLPDILESSYKEAFSVRDPLAEDQGVFGDPVYRHSWQRRGNNKRSFDAKEHREMSSEQKTAEAWHGWINFDSCDPPVNDIGSEQSAFNLVDDSTETSLPPCMDPRDLLPSLRQEFVFEDVSLDNTQSALSLFESNENELESVNIPPAYDLVLGNSPFSYTNFSFSQCGDAQALPNAVTEQPSSRRRPKDQHITEPLKRNMEAMGSVNLPISCPSKDLEEEFGALSAWNSKKLWGVFFRANRKDRLQMHLWRRWRNVIQERSRRIVD